MAQFWHFSSSTLSYLFDVLKEKLDPKLVAATAAAVILAVVAVVLLFPGAFPFKFAEKKPDPPKVDTTLPPPPVEKPKPAQHKARVAEEHHAAPTPVVEKVVKPEKQEEAVKRIEAKVRLKKPQSPSQIGEYLPLVYWAAREIGRLGHRERALEWVEEGLSFSQDASFFSYGALLDLKQGRRALAQSKAEQALASPAYLDPRAIQLAQAVIVLVSNPSDSAARSFASSYE